MYFFLTDFHFLLYLFGFIAGKLIFYFQTLMYDHKTPQPLIENYSTVTDFAKLRGWSTSVPLIKAT